MRYFSILIILLLPGVNAAIAQDALAGNRVRVASYNIRFLGSQVSTQGDRLEKLKQVVRALDADIIGLQEVADRASVELLFDKSTWQVVIDDDSTDAQDVAIAIRKPFSTLGCDPDLDADDANFICSDAPDDFFPNRRDALGIEVAIPGTSSTITVISVHAKSRLGGRDVTDPRREGAARMLAQRLKAAFSGRKYALLGDFNDNPDDCSLNILETGDPETSGGMEEVDGPLMINLMEPLAAQDMVSHGASEARLDNATGLLDIKINGSRERNNSKRGTGVNTGPILFDQILIPVSMKSAVVPGSTTIFRDPLALKGPGQTQPSDHLPIYVDFHLDKLAQGDAATTAAQ